MITTRYPVSLLSIDFHLNVVTTSYFKEFIFPPHQSNHFFYFFSRRKEWMNESCIWYTDNLHTFYCQCLNIYSKTNNKNHNHIILPAIWIILYQLKGNIVTQWIPTKQQLNVSELLVVQKMKMMEKRWITKWMLTEWQLNYYWEGNIAKCSAQIPFLTLLRLG